MRWNTIALAIALTFLGTTIAGAQTPAMAAWDAAMAAYKADQLDAAQGLLEEFRKTFPDDAKADDALWFIGRIHVKAERPREAERAFRELIALPFRSNRYTETVHDLARVRASQGHIEEAIELLESVRREKDLASEDRRVLRLLAELVADRAAADRKAYRDRAAIDGWQQSIELYEQLLGDTEDEKELQGDLGALGSVWADLADAAPDRASHDAARQNAVGFWRQAVGVLPGSTAAARLDSKAAALERGETTRLSGTIEAYAGAAPVSIPSSSFVQWGALAEADLALVLPLAWMQELRVGLVAGHDSFTLKSSNFTAAEINAGAVRIVQRTNALAGSLAWHAGSRHALHSELELAATWSPAEDLGDTSYGFSADERLDWRLGPSWKLSMDFGVAWEAWPDDLLAMTKELDRWEASVNPKATWYPTDDLSVEAGYAFGFRQYLNAVYPPDTLSKQYLVHEADLGVRWTPGRVLRLSVDYALTWNDSRRYTVTVYGPGALTVADYYDYLQHTVDLKADLRWSPDLRTAVSGSVAYQAFSAYPARDATRTFTGSMRADWLFGVDSEAAWRFWPRRVNRVADLWAVARASLTGSISNNTWEDSIQTNSTAAVAYVGLRAELP